LKTFMNSLECDHFDLDQSTLAIGMISRLLGIKPTSQLGKTLTHLEPCSTSGALARVESIR
jgi:hypothetical protein